ncbi:MAG TPA: collagen binding domain-containing protein, partial [Atopostipes sp.]|nr:collagen binding domain-containing protein [Atopostipes sp.]
MKNKKRNFLLIWILALALLLNVLAFVPVVADDGEPEGRNLLTQTYVAGEAFNATLKLFVLKDGVRMAPDIQAGDTINIDDIDAFEYEFKFEIDDGFKFVKNDYVSLDLSRLNKSFSFASWDVMNNGVFVFGGHEAGTHTLDDHGVVKITFDKNIEKINGLKERSGYAYGYFAIEDQGGELLEKIKIPFESTDGITFYIRRTNDATSDIAKSGEWDDKNDVIVWTIDVNTELEDLKNVVLTDVIPEGLIVDKVEIVDLEVKTGESGITEDGGYGASSYSTNANNEQAIDIALGALKHEAKRVKITTSFDSGNDGEKIFENKASWTADDDKKSQVVSATVETDRLETIGKSVEAVGGNRIKWTINYVGDGKTSSITDVLKIPEGLMVRLVEDRVKLDGKVLSKKDESNSNESTYSVTLDKDNRTITLSFENLPNVKGEPYTITYETETFYDGKDGAKDFTLSNKATYDGSSSTASITVEKKSVLTKEKADILAYSNGETLVHWTIEINENNECWKDVVLTEFIPEGFVFAGAEIKENDDSESLNPSSNNNNEITFDLGEISTKTTIRITTKLTDPSKFISGDDIMNKAKVEWNLCGDGIGIGIGTGNGTSDKLSQEFEAGFDKEDLDHEMWKSGKGIKLNEDKTKGIASWEIYYITFKNTLNVDGGFTITDKLIDNVTGHKYLTDSFKLDLNDHIVELQNLAGTSENPAVVTNNGVTINYSLTFVNDNEFTLTIYSAEKSVNQSIINDYANIVILTYESEVPLASLDDVAQNSNEKNTLKNEATVSNKNVGDITRYGTNKFHNTFSKNGKKSASKKSETRYKWTVDLNYKSKIIQVNETITDVLTGNHRYLPDTLKIYKAQLTNTDLGKEPTLS